LKFIEKEIREMKLSVLMTGYTPNPAYEGFATNDDYVLAINTGEAAKIGDYEVVEVGVSGLDSQMNPITQDKTYIRAGQSTMKTGTQRSFKVSGDRYVGDPAQDFMLAHKMKYGTGNGVVTDYVYFCLLNGKGEKGKVSIIVNSDGSGNAGESSAVDIELKKSGSIPTEYTYAAEEP
jgi:hypothetical protein